MKNREVFIIHPWGLGDLILLTPVLNVVSTLNPNVKFSFLIFQTVSTEPIEYAPYLNAIHFCDWKFITILKSLFALRKTKYDSALFTSGINPIKAGFFLHLIRARFKIGEYSKFRFPLLSSYSKYDESLSRTHNNYQLLSLIFDLPDWDVVNKNVRDYSFHPSFYLKQSNLNFATAYIISNNLADVKYICIHPGSLAKNKYRRWPKEYFVHLIQSIKEHFGCLIVVIAGPDEVDEANYISNETNSILLKGESLKNVAAVIAKCDFFLNTDSGLGHVASCFNKISLTIFGPGDERQTSPFSDNSHIISNEIFCSPCIRSKVRNCKSECLTNLTPDQVFDKVKDIFPL